MYLRDIHKLIAQSIPVMGDHPYQVIKPSFEETKASMQKSNMPARPNVFKRPMRQRRWSQ
jgi:hypothetical protein